MTPRRYLQAWGKILAGKPPMLSIEITRECPLHCPGCYAYGDRHLGGGVTLRQLSDLRGDALVNGVIDLVRRHGPLHVSIVGGEPLIRHRELDRILPALSEMGVFTLVVTSAVIPVPKDWNTIPRVRIAVSIDGLREDHDRRRKPATYDRVLQNIAGRRVDISWVVTRPMMQRPGYLDEYLAFWTARPEIDRIWLSTYTPQVGEQSEEMLTPDGRRELVAQLPQLKRRYPALLMHDGIAEAFGSPPVKPDSCTFARLSVAYSADLRTRIEPCFYGGQPDCSQCGCAVTAGLHWLGNLRLAGPLRAFHVMRGSMLFGSLVNLVNQLFLYAPPGDLRRGAGIDPSQQNGSLIQIRQEESSHYLPNYRRKKEDA
jgi:MoaA/NifB/PqqE/SkfB family radical SAM enzyme